MGHAPGLARRFRSLLWKPGLDDEIADELAFHLEMRAREYAARGLAPAAAAAAARRRLGDLAEVRAACRAIGSGRDRAQRRARWLAETVQDLRLAGRRFGDQPGSTLLAVLALAIGLAGAATAWRVVRAVRACARQGWQGQRGLFVHDARVGQPDQAGPVQLAEVAGRGAGRRSNRSDSCAR